MTPDKRNMSATAAPDTWIRPGLFFVVIGLASLASFSPLLKYYFAQDDFILLLKAMADAPRALRDHVSTPGQFRPLTKVLYFKLMYGVFGLNALPYHIVSFLFHLANAILVCKLFRRLGTGLPAAIAGAAFFALSGAFFHVLAWISCIQQLVAQFFMLLSLNWGIDAVRCGTSNRRLLSVAAFVAALMSMEQTYAAPLLLFLCLVLGIGGDPLRPATVARALAVHFYVLGAYLAFMVLWKTLPTDGTYRFHVGLNVLHNITTYMGWMYEFAPRMTSTMNWSYFSAKLSHVAFLLFMAYHVLLGRYRQIAFGLAYFSLPLLPVLLLEDHTFYLHTYIPAIGTLYFIALLIDDVLHVPFMRRGHVRFVVLLVVVAVTGLLSVRSVRENETGRMQAFSAYARSFVLRRAMIARRLIDRLQELERDPESVDTVYMVYGSEGGRDIREWNNRNVIAATGDGAAIKLFYKNPDLNVVFKVVGDSLHTSMLDRSRVFLFTDFGNLYEISDTLRANALQGD